jgi:hypothetical protein
MKKISRRDFLKLGWNSFQLALATKMLPRQVIKGKVDKNLPNIVVLICDAMSAKNLSLYGYPRKTTPNLEKLAQKAFVYHNHYANGSFTTSGTASLLTGLLPWTHRAVNLYGIIKKDLWQHNIFNLLGNDYFKLAYTQNLWAYYFLDQFSLNINTILPISEFGLMNKNLIDQKFTNDHTYSKHALERMIYYNRPLA